MNKNNMNKWFALILTGVIIGVLLWNPDISDASIVPTHLNSNGIDYGYGCGYGPWEDDPSNPCKERREIKEFSDGSCVGSGTYEYRNKADGTVCGYEQWENDSSNPCKERREIKKCSGGSCKGSRTYEYKNKPDYSRPKGCDDRNPCTPDQCINGKCRHDKAYPQDGVCSGPFRIFNIYPCTRNCCRVHDDCYARNACTWASWTHRCSSQCDSCNSEVRMCFFQCGFPIPPIWIL